MRFAPGERKASDIIPAITWLINKHLQHNKKYYWVVLSGTPIHTGHIIGAVGFCPAGAICQKRTAECVAARSH
jgi:hypothetical protein